METETRTFIGWIMFLKNKKRLQKNKPFAKRCIRCDDALPKKWSHAMCADCLEETNE